jgi:hypothetical protein
MLEAASVGKMDDLVPKPDPKKQAMAEFQEKMMVEMAKADLTTKMVEIDLTLAKIEGEKADTVKTMTDARVAQLDGMTMMLRERRDGIEQTLRGGLGGLAQQPGNGGGAGRPSGFNGAAAPGGAAGLLGRPPMAGARPAFAGPVGGVAR